MMPRKRRIAISIIFILLIIFIILGIFGFLFSKTDIFKSNETLFAKYLIQNFDIIEALSNPNTLEIENKLNNNKYVSELEGNIEYTENIGTSDENKNNPINDVGIKIKSNVDKVNNYNYKDISIGTDEEDLIKLEYLNQNEINGIRLNGIKQFVSTNNNEDSEISQKLGIDKLQSILSEIDIDSIFNFTEEEILDIKDTYLKIIQSNVSKDKYYKQANSLITIDGKDVKTNAYYIKFTIEEYNNLYVKILEQLSKDETILSRIDLIEKVIKEKYPEYEQDESLRETFVNKLNNEIKEINNNNIGSDEVKIIVYENNEKTVRTSIEKVTNKINIDLYDKSAIKINNIELLENAYEQYIKIERTNSELNSNLLIEFEKKQNSEIVNNIKLDYNKIFENNQLNKKINLGIANKKYKAIFNIVDNIQIVQEFENQITLDSDNVNLNDLSQEQVEAIIAILDGNMQKQLMELNNIVDIDNYTKMLQNLEIINENLIELPKEGEVSETERKRFNSQFEFFVSKNLTAENIKDLMQVVKDNFEDMKILLKNGDVENLDVEKLDSSSQESKEYIENISEILVYIKENSNNDKKQEDTIQFIENNSNNKYDVTIQYDDNGLAKIIRIKIQREQ